MSRPAARATELENDARCVVTRLDFRPGEETGARRYDCDLVFIAVTDCVVGIEDEEGPREVAVPMGSALRRDAGLTVNILNAGKAMMTLVLVEMRGPA